MTDRILLIYEIVPEDTDVYILPVNEFTAEELEIVKRCHGHFINLADEPPEAEVAMNWLSERLVGLDHFKVYTNKSGKPKLDRPLRPATPVSHLVVTGFIL